MENEEKKEEEIQNKQSFWRDKKNLAIIILSLLLFCALFLPDTKVDQINELSQQIKSQSAQVEKLQSQKNELQKENEKIETLETNVQTLSKEKEDLILKLNAMPSTEELQKELEEKNQKILNLETQIGTLTAEKTQIEAQNGVLQQQLSNHEKSSSNGAVTTTSSNKSSPNRNETSATVYITDTGSKYHTGSCSYLRSSKHAISKNNAISQGYTACSRCNP